MRHFRILSTPDSLAQEFTRCCRDYSSTQIAVAWCGNPKQTLPYLLLENFKGSITATIGTSFDYTHPEAFEWFKHIGARLTVFRDKLGLFHPKVYLFEDGRRYALFVGSSNLTYGGFYTNVEVNILIEDHHPTGKEKDLVGLKKALQEWRSSSLSFKPSAIWLKEYRKRYAARARLARKHGILTPPRFEEEIGTASWLRNADWGIYYQKVISGLKSRGGQEQEYHRVLDKAATHLPLPWRKSYFADQEKRRIIGGIGEENASLGHIGASGEFRRLIAKGTDTQLTILVKAVNRIAKLSPPIPWKQLQTSLTELEGLGFTMKVWSRLLCLVHPDLYCTVASIPVRRNLSKTLGVPQSRFVIADGYIQLIKLVHESHWFGSKRPKDKREAAIWDRRAAFLDAIFY